MPDPTHDWLRDLIAKVELYNATHQPYTPNFTFRAPAPEPEPSLRRFYLAGIGAGVCFTYALAAAVLWLALVNPSLLIANQ